MKLNIKVGQIYWRQKVPVCCWIVWKICIESQKIREENEQQFIIELNEGSDEIINSEVNTPITDSDNEVENEEIAVEKISLIQH